jgi:hypothetical protein
MKLRIALLPSLLAIALLCVPSLTYAQAVHQVYWQDIELADYLIDDCTGELVFVLGIAQFHEQFTWDDSGNVHVMVHDNFQNVSAVGVTSGIIYQAVGTDATGGANGSPDGAYEGTYTATFNLISAGSSDNLKIHIHFHIVVESDGSARLEKDFFDFTCGG